jgi:hypothetical protein
MSRGRTLLVVAGLIVLVLIAGFSSVSLAADGTPASKSAPAPAAEKPEAGAKSADAHRAREDAIFKLLEQTTSLDVKDKPLDEVFKQIQDKHHIPLYIDKKALESSGIETSAKVTCTLSDIPLESVLRWLLCDLELDWTIRNDVLLITTPEVARSQLESRVYDISDLCLSDLDYPYSGKYLPTGNTNNSTTYSYEMEQYNTSRGNVKLGGFMNGNLSQRIIYPASDDMVVDKHISNASDFKGLIKWIIDNFEPFSWYNNGGQGQIGVFDRYLTIIQTPENHRAIEELLADLRSKRQAVPSVVIDLRWLWLDSKQYEQLIHSVKSVEAGQISLDVDPKVLEQLANAAGGFRGRIACTSGQLVHLASGDRHVVVTGTTPETDSGIVYKPHVQTPNAGVVVEIRPSVLPDKKTAMLDLHSIVTRWLQPEPPATVGTKMPAAQVKEKNSELGILENIQQSDGSASIQMDRPVMPTQQIAATVRVPLGKPVLVGAMTFAPAKEAGLMPSPDNPKQLVLIATTSAAAQGQ